MSEQERFVTHLQNATSIVSTWPEWKQTVLGAPITPRPIVKQGNENTTEPGPAEGKSRRPQN